MIRRGTGEHQNPMDTRLRTKEEACYTIKNESSGSTLLPAFVSWWFITCFKKAEKSKLKNKEKQAALSHQLQTDVIPFGACLIFTPLFAEKRRKSI